MAAILLLLFISLVMGCVTEKEVVYKKIYFADTNGVTTTIYYPDSFEKDMRIKLVDDERWRYVASKVAPDDGVAKEMKLLPIDLSMDNPHPYILNQNQWSEKYHKLNPECTYDFQTYSH
jgi:hypothetical protein